MCDKEQLVSYVYDELNGAERKAFQHHLASCLSCREEVQALRATRTHLGAWMPPDGAVGLRIPAPAGEPSSRLRRLRRAAWPLAAAAALVLAVGSALANVEVSVADGGVTIRAGAARAASEVGSTAAVGETLDAIAALQQRVRDLEGALAAQSTPAPASVTAAAPSAENARIDDKALLRRVQQLITESEGRQQQQFAVRLMRIVRELQAEHTMDLVRLEQNFNQHQAVSSDEIYRQREEMKQFYRLVNQQQR